MSSYEFSSSGIPDDQFIRGKVPMTKSEVRAVTISKLRLKPGLHALDIGAGTGSVSIEMAHQGCNVVAIERNPEGIWLINENKKKFGLDIEVMEGNAPIDLIDKKDFDRVFIGGSGGNLLEIFTYLSSALKDGGILVANTITIENTGIIMDLLKEHNYQKIEMISMNISRSKKLGDVHLMMAENPINIISAEKGR